MFQLPRRNSSRWASSWNDTAQTRDHRATHVYASRSQEEAAYVADMARNPEPPTRGADGRLTMKTSAHGTRHAYEVEPTGRMMRDPNEKLQPWYDPACAIGFRSRQPLRVVREVARGGDEPERTRAREARS